jgi:hypothetical protein
MQRKTRLIIIRHSRTNPYLMHNIVLVSPLTSGRVFHWVSELLIIVPVLIVETNDLSDGHPFDM